MYQTKRVARILAIVAGISMLGLAGPAAFADDQSGGNHGNHGNHGSHGNPSATPAPAITDGGSIVIDPCVVVDRPERTLGNGKVLPAKTHISQECLQPQPDPSAQAGTDRAAQRDARAQAREAVRAAGGTWGAVVRQETLVKVATRLAERHEQAPTSAALGRILTLINFGLPQALQIDIDAFLAQYGLVFADLIKSGDGDKEASPEPSTEPSTEPSPEPSTEPSPEPSPSASV